MNVVLISTYELGRQPFGLASPAAWLRREGARVTCLDLSRQPLDADAVRRADLLAFYLPMHTATRIALSRIRLVRRFNPYAHLCCYGLYAPLNEDYLRKLGVRTVLGGEFEEGLLRLLQRLRQGRGQAEQPEPKISLARQQFLVPDRAGLPALDRYARLQVGGETRTIGYTQASRGCRHLCRHCPIVPVYAGHFRIVQAQVVLEDIRRQVAAGAQHITFGDPDFFNGPRHSLRLLEALHREFPQLSYDVTIKIEHLLNHSRHLPALRDTGCLFVTSAVESLDDRILELLDKGHTRADFFRAVHLCREVGLTLAPTFVPFTPWTTREAYLDMLREIARLDLIEQVAPIQLAIRLLIPASSRLLERPEVLTAIAEFDPKALVYPWKHPDPLMDRLCRQLQEVIKQSENRGESRPQIFTRIWERAHQVAHQSPPALPEEPLVARAAIPHLTEPWYC